MSDLVFESLDKVPEDLREHAKEKDGKIVLSVVPKVKLDEFRDTNIKLSRERDEFATKVTTYQQIVGEDIEAFSKSLEELRTTHKRVKDGELVANSSLDEAIAKRTAEMRAHHEGQLKQVSGELEAWKQKATTTEQKYLNSIIDRAITDAVLDPKSGARPDALPDILQRARSVFKVNEKGEVVPYDGDTVIYGGDGSKPMSALEWMKKLADKAPYFFQGSSGGGAGGGTTIPGTNGYTAEQIAKMPMEEYSRLRKEGKIR